jgi:hypothetical protein
MDAHKDMGEENIDYDDLKAAADANGRSMSETLDIWQRTLSKDQDEHSDEYQSQ